MFVISIHALREEGDAAPLMPVSRLINFYPRPPRGGRRFRGLVAPLKMEFLSTPSARRATTASRDSSTITKISIHALREEGDIIGLCVNNQCRNFYPRPPRGGRHESFHHKNVFVDISIHALREEGDLKCFEKLFRT